MCMAVTDCHVILTWVSCLRVVMVASRFYINRSSCSHVIAHNDVLHIPDTYEARVFYSRIQSRYCVQQPHQR